MTDFVDWHVCAWVHSRQNVAPHCRLLDAMIQARAI